MSLFVINKGENGYSFRLKAGNGEAIGTSEVYPTKEACVDGIESVINNAIEAAVEDHTMVGFERRKNPKFEIYLDRENKYHFRLLAQNGQNILASQAYTAKASCQNGIKSVKLNAPRAGVEERF